MIQAFLKQHRKLRFRSHQAKVGGFTLVELLVAMIVGSMISAGLLFIVVQLVQTNLREAARSDTQRDLQSAIDYIARDVREAVFVYDANCLLDRPDATNSFRSQCPGLRSYLPKAITGTTGFGEDTPDGKNIPVLAFWRVDLLPEGLRNVCKANASAYSQSIALPAAIRGVPCLSGRMYTLVVYSLNNDGSRAIAQGRARIMRYELPQFTSTSIQASPPSVSRGWVDPRGQDTSFLAWPVNKTTLPDAIPTSLQASSRDEVAGRDLPLTDFVDWNGLYDQSGGRGRAPSLAGLTLTPANGSSAANDPPRGFYAYVRGAGEGGSLNQEVVIRIQGNAAGRPGIPKTTATAGVPISLETRVLTRGVTNKTQ